MWRDCFRLLRSERDPQMPNIPVALTGLRKYPPSATLPDKKEITIAFNAALDFRPFLSELSKQTSLLDLILTQYTDDIPSKVLCDKAMPGNFCRGKVQCLGSCKVADLCKVCRTDGVVGVMPRVERHPLLEKTAFGKINQNMTFTSYTNTGGQTKEKKPAVMALLYRIDSTPEQFLDHFIEISRDYASHMATVISQKHGKKEAFQNLRLNTLMYSMDYSENMKYSMRCREIQSAYWTSDSVTIMTGNATFLNFEAWNKPCISLEEGDEVSVIQDVTDGGGSVYRYGVVAKDQSGNSHVLVDHPQWGDDLPCQKMYHPDRLHSRVLVDYPIIVITDDKQHDTFLSRHIVEAHIVGEKGWIHDPEVEKLEPGLAQRITNFEIWSDGAGAHFKQCGTIHALCFLLFGLAIWSFNAPGHGKDKVDGFGGIIKSRVCAYLSAHDIHVGSAKELYDIIVELFDGKEARDRYDADKTILIKRWCIRYVSVADVARPVAKDAVGKAAAVKAIKAVESDLQKVSKAIEKIEVKLQKAMKPATLLDLEGQLHVAVTSRDDLIDRADELTLAAEQKEEDATETEDAKRFTDLKAFHGAGVRSIFAFDFIHPSGLVVRMNNCHCAFCARGFRPDGFWTVPKGCLLQEGTAYVVCERKDEQWQQDKAARLLAMANRLKGGIKVGDLVALGRPATDDGKFSKFQGDKYNSKFPAAVFDAFVIVHIYDINDDDEDEDEGEKETFHCVAYTRREDSMVYVEGDQWFTSSGNDLRVNFGNIDDFPSFKEPRGGMEVEEIEGEEVPLTVNDTCITLSVSHVEQILVACYSGDKIQIAGSG